jgi:endonuclease/exonuclease/phosphatase family metal-dependent hydrolase
MRCSRTFLAAAIAATLAGCPDGDDQPLPDGPPSFTVMTQNLYLGADLDAALTPEVDLAELAEQIWASAQSTDFASRAKLVADAIQSSGADIVALQEVALWRAQIPGDGSFIPNATAVAQDFLEILLAELRSRALDYYVAEANQNGDAELTGTSGNDYRLTDRDAILVKTSLPVVSTSSGTYPLADLMTVQVPPATPGGPPRTASILRGWMTVDFRAAGRTIRLLDTHLEALSADVAARQAADAIAVARPSDQPTILAGDMNLTPSSPGYATFLTGTGLADAWTEAAGSAPGFTCCRTGDLRGGELDRRIDLVFATTQLLPDGAQVVSEAATTSGGLYASDHAGMVVGFTVQSGP